MTQVSAIPLYRAYVRQIRRLPLPYLRHFFRVKVADDMHSILQSSSSLRDRKLKRVSKDLAKIEAANAGNVKAFAHILDLAYGRKGKLKWEIMTPLLSDSKSQVPPRIIHSIEKSRPPVYSPELKALLMSNLARKVKPLASSSLIFPPTLPLRADPSSVDARLLGPLSKRREVNIRWRYFSANWKKIRPPLQVVVEETSAEASPCSTHTNTQRAGIRGFGMQGQKVQEDIETIVGPTWMPRAPTLKEQRTTGISTAQEGVILSRHPSRWLRRRYQELLGRIPILTLSRDKDGHTPGKYSVSLSPNSLAPTLRNSPRPKMEAEDIDNQAWLKMALAGHRREGKSIRE